MAQIISGKQVSSEIKQSLKEQVASLSIKPLLAIVQVGAREDSNVYIRNKIKFASEAGVMTKHFQLPKSTTQDQVGLNFIRDSIFFLTTENSSLASQATESFKRRLIGTRNNCPITI